MENHSGLSDISSRRLKGEIQNRAFATITSNHDNSYSVHFFNNNSFISIHVYDKT